MSARYLVTIALGLLLAGAARATMRTVTSTADSGAGSLRDTIAASAANDTIDFSVAGTITLTSGELGIGRNLTIIGPGAAGIVISGNNASRVFNISGGTVSISNLTISNGLAAGTNGANATSIHPDGYPGSDGQGGGIFNSGTLTLMNCTVAGGTAVGGNGGGSFGGGLGGNGGSASGGAIYSQGTLTLINCTVANGIATAGSGGGGAGAGVGGSAVGGGIFVSVPMTLVNCTINGCSANGGAGGGAKFYGGAGGSGTGGGCAGGTLNLSLLNTIVADNTTTGGPGGSGGLGNGANGTASGPDVSGSVSSQGHNLIGKADGGSGWVGSDLTGTIAAPLNPLLGPLAANGGPTETEALQAGSAAIDAGDDSVTNSLATDQRGHPRKSGAHVDIGAFELGAFTLLVTSTNDSGAGSLRDTIGLTGPEGDTITFASNVVGTIILASGEFDIGHSVNILGPGAKVLAVSGSNTHRVFGVTNGSVTLSGLTIKEGNSGQQSGAGIYNSATLTISNCFIVGCTNFRAVGAGVLNAGDLRIWNSTIASNSAIGGFAYVSGGGLYNQGAAALVNCTIANNLATITGTGGGIRVAPSQVSLSLSNCTIVGNGATGSGVNGTGGGIYSDANVVMSSCIVANNSAAQTSPDVFGVFASGGYNLIGATNGSTGFGATGDQLGSTNAPINPLLSSLGDYGGPTPTLALLPGSPAIDNAQSLGLTTDQRGAPRPFKFASLTNATGGDGSDIGAFELGRPTLTIQKSAANAVLSWQSYYGDFTLQSVTNVIASNSWVDVAGTPVVVGNQYVVTNGPIAGNQFYQLKK